MAWAGTAGTTPRRLSRHHALQVSSCVFSAQENVTVVSASQTARILELIAHLDPRLWEILHPHQPVLAAQVVRSADSDPEMRLNPQPLPPRDLLRLAFHSTANSVAVTAIAVQAAGRNVQEVLKEHRLRRAGRPVAQIGSRREHARPMTMRRQSNGRLCGEVGHWIRRSAQATRYSAAAGRGRVCRPPAQQGHRRVLLDACVHSGRTVNGTSNENPRIGRSGRHRRTAPRGLAAAPSSGSGQS